MSISAQEASSRRRAPALDVAVVGGGMVGAAAALALARAGFSTALLEARAPKPWSADDEVDLREPLRGGASDAALAALIEECVASKWAGHQIGQPVFVQPRRGMSQIGG